MRSFLEMAQIRRADPVTAIAGRGAKASWQVYQVIRVVLPAAGAVWRVLLFGYGILAVSSVVAMFRAAIAGPEGTQ